MMHSHKKAIDALQALKNDLPRCFKYGKEKLPIAVGIHLDVFAHYANDPRFNKATLKEAITLYTSATEYLKKLKSGTPRINLLGQETTLVTQEEEDNAKILLLSRKEKCLKKQAEKAALSVIPAKADPKIL